MVCGSLGEVYSEKDRHVNNGVGRGGTDLGLATFDILANGS